MKQSFEVEYFDGKSSKKTSLTLLVDGTTIILKEKGLSYGVDEVSLSTKLRGVSQTLTLVDGGYCLLKAEDSLSFQKSMLPFLESKIFYSFMALFIMMGIVAFLLSYGSAWTAKMIASVTPQNTLDKISQESLEFFEQEFLLPSKLPKKTQTYLQKSFQKITPKSIHTKLHFYRSPKLKANAFALPSGDIIMLDDLVLMDKDKDLQGIIGVLAHEIGHVKAKHSLRNIIQSSIAGVIVGYFIGDFSTIISGLSTGLISLRYSREFELEADKEGVILLQKNGYSIKPLIKLFEFIEKENNITQKAIFSSHPLFKDRVDKIKRYRLSK